jgi:hypothetical protein
MKAWDFRTILQALKDQGWTITPTANARSKCVPPRADLDIVFISETANRAAQQNTLKDLRRSGFVWESEEAPPKDALRFSNAEIQAESRGGGHVPSQAPIEPVETPDERLERLWRGVKEARGYVDLADEQLDELGRRVDAAALAFTAGQTERASAVERLKAAKAQLDAALEGVR